MKNWAREGCPQLGAFQEEVSLVAFLTIFVPSLKRHHFTNDIFSVFQRGEAMLGSTWLRA